MLRLFNEYEETHFAGVSPEEVRICLFNLRHGLSRLSIDNPSPKHHYLRLCGMLWEMYTCVQKRR